MIAGQREFFRFIAGRLLVGTVITLAAVVAVLYADLGGVATLMRASPDGWLYLILMTGGFWVTIGGITLAIGIMGLGEWNDPPGD